MRELACPHVEPVPQRLRVWSYRYPEAGLAIIAGHLAVAGELPGVDIVVDGHVENPC